MNTATPNQGWVREDFQLPDVDLLRFFFRRGEGAQCAKSGDQAQQINMKP